MDLITLITACALGADPKLMHALVWHQSGGEPWAVSVQGEANPRVYRSLQDAIGETRERRSADLVRVGLAGIAVSPPKISASVLLPCRNVAMAATQIARHVARCKTHPRLKNDQTFCAVAVYRGSWEQPDIKFAADVTTSVTKGDAPNFDMPRGTSTEIFDIAVDQDREAAPPVVDITATFAEQLQSWSSALFPTKPKTPAEQSERTASPAPPSSESPSSAPPVLMPFTRNPQSRELFVRRPGPERPH